jgi:hypothetical protein
MKNKKAVSGQLRVKEMAHIGKKTGPRKKKVAVK